MIHETATHDHCVPHITHYSGLPVTMRFTTLPRKLVLARINMYATRKAIGSMNTPAREEEKKITTPWLKDAGKTTLAPPARRRRALPPPNALQSSHTHPSPITPPLDAQLSPPATRNLPATVVTSPRPFRPPSIHRTAVASAHASPQRPLPVALTRRSATEHFTSPPLPICSSVFTGTAAQPLFTI
jgi:hypothetical protein